MLATVTRTQALWYLTRSTGLVTMVLLTASVTLGIVEINRWSNRRWPRFVTAALHKNVSLLVTVFLAVHIVAAVTDSFAPIGWIDVFVPFTSTYRPIWLGLGAVATDLLIAIIITSLVRERLGYRAFRIVHWTAYACWPVSLVHGLGTGTDTRPVWGMAVYLVSLAVVVGAVWWRLATGWSTDSYRRRGVAIAASVAGPILIAGFLVAGPLRSGWARRAGTPAALLGAARSTATVSSSSFAAPFSDNLVGSISQTAPDGNGQSVVTITASLRGPATGVLHVTLQGPAASTGGVQMTSSSVAVGPVGQPNLYQGQVSGLNGGSLQLTLHDTGGHSLTALANLQIDQSNRVTGVLQAPA
jgi:Ferric reductase like transmembrane component